MMALSFPQVVCNYKLRKGDEQLDDEVIWESPRADGIFHCPV